MIGDPCLKYFNTEKSITITHKVVYKSIICLNRVEFKFVDEVSSASQHSQILHSNFQNRKKIGQVRATFLQNTAKF